MLRIIDAVVLWSYLVVILPAGILVILGAWVDKTLEWMGDRGIFGLKPRVHYMGEAGIRSYIMLALVAWVVFSFLWFALLRWPLYWRFDPAALEPVRR